jgi:ribosomal protein S18 acetylase RimI-like enzyme
MGKLEILTADLSYPKHSDAIIQITGQYALDPMGMKRALSDEVKSTLIDELRSFPTYLGFIAFYDEKAAGVANCFFNFSTFNAAKIINIHDLAVDRAQRGKGIGEALMKAVEKRAMEENCYKITLEVREDNRARSLYERFGFEYGEPRMFFMEKKV